MRSWCFVTWVCSCFPVTHNKSDSMSHLFKCPQQPVFTITWECDRSENSHIGRFTGKTCWFSSATEIWLDYGARSSCRLLQLPSVCCRCPVLLKDEDDLSLLFPRLFWPSVHLRLFVLFLSTVPWKFVSLRVHFHKHQFSSADVSFCADSAVWAWLTFSPNFTFLFYLETMWRLLCLFGRVILGRPFLIIKPILNTHIY